MREIKFRAWGTGIDKTMHYNTDISREGKLLVLYYDYTYEEKENYILMQYTGLKDANGKEIYEGDIVKITNFIHMKTIYEIIWNEEVASFEYKDGPYINEYGDIIPGIHYPNECTVVGNIYENKELLN